MIITVYGTPAPQGSKRHVGHGVMIEMSKFAAPWRDSVTTMARQAMVSANMTTPAISGPVVVEIWFALRKPKSAPKHRQAFPDRQPDIDKLLRSTFDGLSSAGVWEDDARVITVTAHKIYAGEAWGVDLDVPGAIIDVRGIS